MEIPGTSPQGQTLQVQKSKKTLQTSVSVQILKVVTLQLQKAQTSVFCLEGLPGETEHGSTAYF